MQSTTFFTLFIRQAELGLSAFPSQSSQLKWWAKNTLPTLQHFDLCITMRARAWEREK